MTMNGGVHWLPDALEVEFSGGFALELNVEPLVDAVLVDKSGELGRALSDEVVFAYIVVPHLEVKVIPNVMHVDVEVLTGPLWFLSHVPSNRRLPLVVSACHFDVGIHLAESLSIVSKVRL